MAASTTMTSAAAATTTEAMDMGGASCKISVSSPVHGRCSSSSDLFANWFLDDLELVYHQRMLVIPIHQNKTPRQLASGLDAERSWCYKQASSRQCSRLMRA